MFEMVLSVQLVSTLLMTGVIWWVQLVHYPLFALVDPATFPAYEREHVRRTGWLVAPLMGCELGSAVLANLLRPGWELGLGLLLLALIWVTTFLVQVPQHKRLMIDADPRLMRRLVNFNWIRTVLWTLRSLLVVYALSECC